MAKKRKRQPSLGASEIIAELEQRFLAHMRWALVNTKEKEATISALAPEQREELKVEIGLIPRRLTPDERLQIKQTKAQRARSGKRAPVGTTSVRKRKNTKKGTDG